MSISRGIVTAAHTFGICTLFIAVGCSDRIVPNEAAFDSAPLSIVLDQHGSVQNTVFHVSMNSAGDAEVRKGNTRENVEISVKSQERLRRSLRDTEFFALPSIMGRRELDGTVIIVTVVLLDHSHTVVLHATSDKVNDKDLERFGAFYVLVVDSVRSQLTDIERLQVPKRLK